MKKKLLILIFAILSLTLPLGASCGHEHVFKEVENVEATCTENGYVKLACDCGEEKTEETLARGHDVIEYPEKASTCIEQGYDAYEECSRCDYTTKKPLKPLTTHKWTSVPAKEGNCYEKGYNKHSACSVCGEKATGYKETDYVHTNLIDVEVKQATCFEEGYYAHKFCLDCEQEIGKKTMPKLEHTFVSVIENKTANCLEAGITPYEFCINCGHIEGGAITPALGHDIVIVQAKKATCTEDGYYEYETCARQDCNHTTYRTEKKTGHEYYTNASGEYVCKNCGSNEETLVIFENGATEYGIYYNRNADSKENWRDHLNNELKATVGWEFAAASSVTEFNPNDKVISIGINSYSEIAGVTYNPPKDTAIKIVTKGNSIFVLCTDYGIRYGIFELLNVLIGYEKFSIKADNLGEQLYFEQKEKIELTPSQIEREVVKDVDYLLGANSGNTYANALGASAKGNASMGYAFSHDLHNGYSKNDDGVTESLKYNVTTAHNTLGFYPLKRYLEEHPEWYAKDEQGNTKKTPAQVCFYGLWNDPEAIEAAMLVIKYNKRWKSVEVSNMDTGGDCLCSECKDDLGYEYIMFLNKLRDAMDADPETKHMMLYGMIYGKNSHNPPLDENGNPRITTKDKVEIRFAFNDADYFAGFSESDRKLIEDWNKVLPTMHFWTYCFKPNYSMFFFNDFEKKQELFEVMTNANIVSLYDEGAKPCQQYTSFSAFRVYLNSVLARESGENMSDDEAKAYMERITQDFFNEYFGPASLYMRQIFEKQKERANYMYDNWLGEDGLFQQAYVDSGVGFGGQDKYIFSTNELNNNNIGTYESWGYHLLGANRNHGNRFAWKLVYERADFRNMLSWIDQAEKAINNDENLTAEQKQILVNRVELEKIAILYEFMFIYDSRFAVGNNSFSSTLNKLDLVAIGVETFDEAVQLFIDTCRKFGLNSINYASLTDLIKAWKDSNLEVA